MTATQNAEQQRGNFIANMVNAGKSRNGKPKPNIRGSITAPGSNRALTLSLWSHEYPDGAGNMMIGMNGNVDAVSRDDEPMDQFRAHARGSAGPTIKIDRIPGKEPIELENGKIVIFQSKNKEGEKAENGNLRTNFYGFWNDNGKTVEIGIWLHKNKDTGQAFLGGSTQHPMPGRDGPESGTMSQADLERMHRDADAKGMGRDDQDNEDTPGKKPEKPVRRSARFLEEDARSR